MTVTALHVLVEELSAERALVELLPRIVPGIDFQVLTFNGKPALLRKLPGRLAGYATYAHHVGLGVVVLTDRDDEDCVELKDRLEKLAGAVGLRTLSTATATHPAAVVNRIACEELEAWFFGDVPAVASAFPGVPSSLGEKAAFRYPDAITGGTAEAFERVLNDHGYHTTGLNKVAAATATAAYMDVENNRSNSFVNFRDGVRRLVGKDL